MRGIGDQHFVASLIASGTMVGFDHGHTRKLALSTAIGDNDTSLKPVMSAKYSCSSNKHFRNLGCGPVEQEDAATKTPEHSSPVNSTRVVFHRART